VVLETERLLLRPLGIDDLDDFVELHEDPCVTRYISDFDRPQAAARLRQVEREWSERGHGMFGALDLSTGRFLGRVGLRYWPQFDETEVGWVLRRDAWGHGYATEAGRACVEWGFTTLPVPYLTSMIDPPNSASIRVARRLNMSPLREDVLLGDEVVVYALGRHEWSSAVVSGMPHGHREVR
jgi:RimJ/RimL family protein N-acetyltransferase